MLNLNCVICAEIFAASDDVHCTSCGHMFHIACLSQWLQRKTIAGLEKDLKTKNFLILNYSEKIEMLEIQKEAMESLRQECRTLKEQIETMDGINNLLTSTMSEAEKLLNNEKFWPELRVCENKKTDIRNVLKVVQNDLRKEIEHKKSQDQRISQLESENYQLLEKITNLEAAKKNSNNTTIIPNNSTIGLNTPIMSPYVTNIKEGKRLTISPTIKDNIKKIEESSSPYLNIKSCGVLFPPSLMRNHENRPNNDPNNKYTTAKLTTLKISPTKKTVMGGGAIRKTASDLSENYSIFKKPRLGLVVGTTATSKPLASNFAFNGFGGSERVDPFERKSESDDELEIVEENTSMAQKQQLAKQKASATSNLNSRLKTRGLRNFKVDQFERKSESDDELEIVEENTSMAQKQQLAKQKASATSNLNSRLKTRGLRNFKVDQFERKSESDDELEIVEENTSMAQKQQLAKQKASPTSNLNSRLKTRGLRNFKVDQFERKSESDDELEIVEENTSMAQKQQLAKQKASAMSNLNSRLKTRSLRNFKVTK